MIEIHNKPNISYRYENATLLMMNSWFFIDLVFYNYILKYFVIIDLKLGDLTHQDIFASKYTLYLPTEGEFKKELNLENYVKKDEENDKT